MDERPRYTTIVHNIRIELDLTCNEYCVADIIYCLSNNPSSKVMGWCYASREKIAEYMGISKQAALGIIKKLEKIGIIEKDSDTKHLRTTAKWYDSVISERIKYGGKESLPVVKKVDHERSRKFTADGKESLPNIYSYNNSDNTITKVIDEKSSEIEEFGNKDINLIMNLFDRLLGVKQPKQQMNRFTAKRLIKRFGIEELQRMIELAMSVQGEEYAPRVACLKDFEDNIGRLAIYFKKKNTKQSKPLFFDLDAERENNKMIGG